MGWMAHRKCRHVIESKWNLFFQAKMFSIELPPRELLGALDAAAAAGLLPAGVAAGGGSEVGIQTEDRTPRETRQTQVRKRAKR